MARKIKNKYCVTGTLVAVSPLHVGGMSGDSMEDPTVDMPLVVNGAGKVCIPETSLVGALSAYMERIFDTADVRKLWGQPSSKMADDGTASFVSGEDAVVIGEDLVTEICDGVGIDRVTGSAASGIKYDREIVPKGTKFSFQLEVETQEKNDSKRAAMLGYLLAAMQKAEIRLGAAKSRGLGKVRLEDVTVTKFTMDSRQGILGLLRDDPDALTVEKLIALDTNINLKPLPIIEISVSWKPKGPVLVKANAEGMLVDMLPLVSFDGKNLATVIAWSGIKGVLRSHSERIWRTVTDNSAADKSFLKQLEECPLVETLYGANKKAVEQTLEEGKNEAPLRGLSALSGEDCYSEATISREQWWQILGASGTDQDLKPLMDVLEDTGWKDFVPAMHVAIDRWTGGAADGFLYSVLEPSEEVKWPEIEMSIDLDRLAPQKHKDAALALLLLTLKDFSTGMLPLGFGGNRGLGDIEIESIRFKTPDDDKILSGTLTAQDGFENLEGLEAIDTAWQAYLNEKEEECVS